ncbi:Zn-dependent protease with chaperone function [Pseudomonas marginalis]|uniref:M48 family metallopeptidase n=1 Tax=Pseudomonas marginalis TaxID=298 RepID=UPI00209D40B4|nr:M48 family metallopeptidase [Pseudomonas marginalis]MCP1510014.1 Zn-dependent protease with chaperone function [Pseudomonas marginalis]MCP1521672.1 Zn-dependent protease with chaperone function [Pseudomonas marginalis]MDQ0502741.1 Zn-dependent protease with chaperone function [Pseudomonas marginalis]
MNAIKLIFLLIISPLLLAGVGTWELQRATEGARVPGQAQAYVNVMKPVLKTWLEENPTIPITVGSDGLSPEQFLSRLARMEAELPTARHINRILHALAAWVIGLGLLAALIGVAALAGTQWAGRRAQQSREQLLQVFSLGSRLLPYVLVSHVVAMAATVALALSYEGLALWHIGQLGKGEVKLMGWLGVIAAICLYSIWLLLKQLRHMLVMFEPTPLEMFGRVVTAEQAPGLWRQVRELAGKLGALPPDHIVVSLALGFYVTSSPATVRPAETPLRGRTLHVPLLYLGLLSREEVDAVIGHELAHFVGEDTEYSLRFVPIYDGVSRSLETLEQTMMDSDLIQAWLMRPSFLLGVFFMQHFDHAVNRWSRERELLADAAGGRLAGNAAAASALLRISVLQTPVEGVLLAHCDTPVEGDVLNAALAALQGQELQAPDEALETHQPHPTDSHPSNGERLHALRVPWADAMHSATRAVDAQAASLQIDALFSAAHTLREQLSRDLFVEAAGEHTAQTHLLETLAASAQGEHALHEGGRRRAVLMAVLAVPFVLLGLAMMSEPWLAPERLKGTALSAVGAGAGIASIALIFLWLGIRRFKRAPQTALRLTPEHFVFANLAQPLPIEHIATVTLQFLQGIWVTIELKPEAPLPELRKTAFGVPGARVNRKKHQVLLQMAQLCIDNKKIEPYEGLTLMTDYVNASLARKILQNWQD